MSTAGEAKSTRLTALYDLGDIPAGLPAVGEHTFRDVLYSCFGPEPLHAVGGDHGLPGCVEYVDLRDVQANQQTDLRILPGRVEVARLDRQRHHLCVAGRPEALVLLSTPQQHAGVRVYCDGVVGR